MCRGLLLNTLLSIVILAGFGSGAEAQNSTTFLESAPRISAEREYVIETRARVGLLVFRGGHARDTTIQERRNGRLAGSVSIGNVATKDEICTILHHRYFLNDFSLPVGNGANITVNIGNWMLARPGPIARSGPIVLRHRSLVNNEYEAPATFISQPTITSIQKNLNECLEQINQNEPQRYISIIRWLFHSESQNQYINYIEYPCYQSFTIEEEYVSDSGQFLKREISRPYHLNCANSLLYLQFFEYAGTFSSDAGSGYSSAPFLALIGLREGGLLATGILDRAADADCQRLAALGRHERFRIGC